MSARVLVTCPPMIAALPELAELLAARGLETHAPHVVQQLSEGELVKLVPEFEGWIAGDDPVTRAVLDAGRRGRLQAAVKWGIGTDNVDFDAARELGIPIVNTPGMFGAEVADVALGYLIGLARGMFAIHRGVGDGEWPKPRGISLSGRRAALVGFGDIGRALARRLLAIEMQVVAYDPRFEPQPGLEAVEPAAWPERLEQADAILLACALTRENRHLLGAAVLDRVKPGVLVVNVARGALIDEAALAGALESGRVGAAALDVFEQEPLPTRSPLRRFPDRVVFGSHNASNTAEAVARASREAIERLCALLGA